MATVDRTQKIQENERVTELLKQGLSTEQIHRRTGVHKRRILRVKAKLGQPVA
jgi:uncharacterized protein YerC